MMREHLPRPRLAQGRTGETVVRRRLPEQSVESQKRRPEQSARRRNRQTLASNTLSWQLS